MPSLRPIDKAVCKCKRPMYARKGQCLDESMGKFVTTEILVCSLCEKDEYDCTCQDARVK